MILHGNQRGGARDLALHLLKAENEHVAVHELRGFVSDDLVSALKEAQAVSRGTQCKQFLYSLSLNPPPGEVVPIKDFEDTILRVEKKLGLENQPRAIVFHEKKGRRHAHCVWSRIDTENMKAIPLPYTKRKLMELSRELFLEHGWQMPCGMMNSKERDSLNFTMAQWQQARRVDKDVQDIKRILQDCWAISDTQSAFGSALKQRGYILARGDRRGFVVLDHKCEIYAAAKWIGLKTKDIRAKLTDADALPSVEEAKAQIAKDMQLYLSALQKEHHDAIDKRAADIESKIAHMSVIHQDARQTLEARHNERRIHEIQQRQLRFNKGLRGWLDRLTGARSRIQAQNEFETSAAQKRDAREKDALIQQHLEARRGLQARLERLSVYKNERDATLSRDIEQYEDFRQKRREHFEVKPSNARQKRDFPSRER